jgi:hypothetical protein
MRRHSVARHHFCRTARVCGIGGAEEVGVATCRPTVTLFCDSRKLLVVDCADPVRETVANTFVYVEIDFAVDSPAAAHGPITNVGPLRISSLRSTALTSEHTPTLAREGLPPSIFVGLQMAGACVITPAGS